jgi:hypothetical protein
MAVVSPALLAGHAQQIELADEIAMPRDGAITFSFRIKAQEPRLRGDQIAALRSLLARKR